jgi:hypothetical protein
VPATPPPPPDRSSHGLAMNIINAELRRLRGDLERVDDADVLDVIETQIIRLAKAKIQHARALMGDRAA